MHPRTQPDGGVETDEISEFLPSFDGTGARAGSGDGGIAGGGRGP